MSTCSVALGLELFGDRWSLLVIRDVMNGVRKFDDLVEHLGISRATLSARLRHLVDNGILAPSEYVDVRGRTRIEYRLTQRGWGLRHALIALQEWGNEFVVDADADVQPLRFVDRSNGHGVHLELVDDETGEPVDSRTLRLVPAPATQTPGTTG